MFALVGTQLIGLSKGTIFVQVLFSSVGKTLIENGWKSRPVSVGGQQLTLMGSWLLQLKADNCPI